MNLLIIDDAHIRTFIVNSVTIASGPFKHIHCVNKGGEATAYFQKVHCGTAPAPDVVLLDLNRPKRNSVDFVNALRTFSIPGKECIGIVILTSSTDSADLQQARSIGIDRYLIKPLTINGFQITVFSLDKTLWKRSLGGSDKRRLQAA